MARSDHTARARPNASPRSQRKPSNPLGRLYWILDEFPNPAQRLPAICATLAEGIQAVTRILANSEAYRVLQGSSADHPPTHSPLAPELVEGLFAALYMLSEQAAQTSWDMLEWKEESAADL